MVQIPSLVLDIVMHCFLFLFADIVGDSLCLGCTAIHCCLIHFKVSHDMSTIILYIIQLINLCCVRHQCAEMDSVIFSFNYV